MNKKLIAFRYLYLAMMVSLCAFMAFVTATPSLANGAMSPFFLDEPVNISREDMMNIAERYWTYRWQAINSEQSWEKVEYEENGQTKYKWNLKATVEDHMYNDKHIIGNVDTPDIGYCETEGRHPWGCWKYAPAINVGIPYYWAGHTAIRNDILNNSLPELFLGPIDGKGTHAEYFDSRISAGYPAGDVINDDGKWHDYMTGVDCSGFVMQVWRMGAVYNPSMVNAVSRPILVWELRPGDIIYDRVSSEAHVVIFKEWEEGFDPTQQLPIAHPENGTTFWVYESAMSLGKVVKSQYRLASVGTLEDKVPYGTPDSVPPNTDIVAASSTTHKVQIRRIKSCTIDPETNEEDCLPHCTTNPQTGQQECEGSVDWTMQPAYPRSYFTPIDVELIIDASPSMDPKELDYAKNIVKSLRLGDKVGIVAFSREVTYSKPLMEITDESARSQILLAIDESDDWRNTGTSLGVALRLGRMDLMENATYDSVPYWEDPTGADIKPDPVRIMILLSDGEENITPFANDPIGIGVPNQSKPFLEVLRDENIPVYAFQIGGTLWPNRLLQDIAGITGGRFVRSVAELLSPIQSRILSDEVVKAAPYPDLLPEDGNYDTSWNVDSSIGEMYVSVYWSGLQTDPPLTVTLERPDHSTFNPASDILPNVSFISDVGFASVIIRSPEPGEWTLHISGTPGQKFQSMITTKSAMDTYIVPDQKEYALYNPIHLVASLNDNDSASFESDTKYVLGADVVATATYPNPNLPESAPFNLYDDGQHGDGEANDGVYGGSFDDTGTEGVYRFNIKFSGLNNREGPDAIRAFTREKNISVAVVNAPKVLSIVPNSPSPTNYYHVNYTVKFSKLVVGVDMSDFVLTADGVSNATIKAVTPIASDNGWGDTYIVGVDTGKGDGTVRLDLIDNDTIKEADSGNIYVYSLDGKQLVAAYEPDKLGTRGTGNGNFEGTELVIGKTTRSTFVTKFEDTDDGKCDGDCSLREAIATAFPGETVSFDTALADETIYLNSTLVTYSDVTIDGSMLAVPITISGDTDNDSIGDIQVFDIKEGSIVVLDSLTISQSNGYGIKNNGILSVIKTTFSGNGGGIYHRSYEGGVLTVANSTFVDNSTSNGAGIYIFGGIDNAEVTITNSTFSDNSALNDGGAIYNSGNKLTITGSTFSSNSATYYGGGILNNGGTLTIVNSTIFGNTARDGGGIDNTGGKLKAINVTLSGNSASGVGGGIRGRGNGYQSSELYLINTIIANSPSGGDCDHDGSIAPGAPVLVGDAVIRGSKETNSCYATMNGDPMLGPLADNGGLTQTMALLPNSPALNAGDDAMCAASPVNNLDQRGIIRPQDSHCDLGAFEAMDENPPTVSAITIANATNAQPGSMDFTVTFSEPVTGVDVSDFTLTTTDAPGATISSVSGSGSIYTVSVQVGTGDGTIRLDVVDDDTIADLASHPLNGGFTGGETYWIAKVVSKLTDTSDGLCDADCSLREAITAAAPGDTITFDTALSGGTIHLASTLSLSRDIIIDGSALAIPIIISGDTNNDDTGDIRVFYVNSRVVATLNGLTISKGRVSDKGAGVLNEGHLIITDTSFSGNSASSGGSIYSTGGLTVTSSTFLDNNSNLGAGIYSTGNGLTITNSTFSDNSSSSAAVYSVGNELTITNSIFSSNLGGGVYNQGSLMITNSTFSGNSNGSGSGVYNQGTLTIANSTFSGNRGDSGTGAYNTGTLTVINSTFASNYVGGDGGGVIYNDGGLLNYVNNIIANSTFATSGSECVNANGGTIGTNIANLVEDGSCSAALRGDPHLGVLANNGGPTQTMMLLPGSPAIDAGNDVVCAAAPVSNLDQRGIVRLQDLHCDIGAYERIIPVVLSSVRVDTNPTSASSLKFTVTFSESVTGVDTSDFSLTATNISGATITGVSGSGATRTIAVNKGTVGSVNATIRLDILDDDSIRDASNIPLGDLGVGNGNFGDGESYTIAANVTRPTMLFPHNDYVTNNTMPTFTWGTVTDASRYEVMVATDSTFTQNVNSSSIEEPTFTFSSPLTDSKYYWRVRAYNIVNEPGGWSTLRDFTIDTVPPSPPILSSPANGVTIRSVPTCRWKSVSDAVLYQFQLDNDSDFSSPLVSVEQRTVSRSPAGGLRGTYYWRTRAKDSAGNWGDWSQVFTFTVVSPR